MTLRRCLAAILLLGSVSCGSSTAGRTAAEDAGSPVAARDGGQDGDSGTRDGAVETEAGTQDGGARSDAGARDAGSASDAGSRDASAGGDSGALDCSTCATSACADAPSCTRTAALIYCADGSAGALFGCGFTQLTSALTAAGAARVDMASTLGDLSAYRLVVALPGALASADAQTLVTYASSGWGRLVMVTDTTLSESVSTGINGVLQTLGREFSLTASGYGSFTQCPAGQGTINTSHPLMAGVTAIQHNGHIPVVANATDMMVTDDSTDGDSAGIWAGDRTVVVAGDGTGVVDTAPDCADSFTATGNLQLFQNLWTAHLTK